MSTCRRGVHSLATTAMPVATTERVAESKSPPLEANSLQQLQVQKRPTVDLTTVGKTCEGRKGSIMTPRIHHVHHFHHVHHVHHHVHDLLEEVQRLSLELPGDTFIPPLPSILPTTLPSAMSKPKINDMLTSTAPVLV